MEPTKKPPIIKITLTVFALLVLPLAIYLVQKRIVSRKGKAFQPPAEIAEPLTVSINNNNLHPGDGYVLGVFKDEAQTKPYSGYLFVKSQTCQGDEYCFEETKLLTDTNTTPLYVDNGSLQLTVEENIANRTVKQKFTTSEPDKQSQWSNEINFTITN